MIQIRELQHFLYCPHRWGVLHLDSGWKENVFTILADIFHEKVHSGQKSYTKAKSTLRNITVYSKELGLYGKLDCMELSYNCNKEIEKINVIEYKPKQPKADTVSLADRLQLYAQYSCLCEHFSNCEVDAYMYYQDTRHRVKVAFDNTDRETLYSVIEKINSCKERGYVPNPVYSEKCNGCSIYDDCMPNIGFINVKKMLLEDK